MKHVLKNKKIRNKKFEKNWHCNNKSNIFERKKKEKINMTLIKFNSPV